MIALTGGLAGYVVYEKHLDDQRFELSVRNYYGVLRVYRTRGERESDRFAAG